MRDDPSPVIDAREMFRLKSAAPAIPGRKPSGIICDRNMKPINPELKDAGEVETEVVVPKRAAKSTALELSGAGSVRLKESRGRCFILVRWNAQDALEFSGRTWFLALRSLFTEMERRKERT